MYNALQNKALWAFFVLLSHIGILTAQHNAVKPFSISSAILKKKVQVQVLLPEGYRASGKKYAVLYVLGAKDPSLSELAATAGALHREAGIPEMIVVGIDNEGDAGKFFACMEKELMPVLARKYRTGRQRILLGKDYAGSRVLYALLTRPHLFDGYISATRQWLGESGDDYRALAEKAFQKPVRYEGKKIFFAKLNGAYDNGDPNRIEQEMQAFSDLLVEKSGRRMATQYQAYDDWGEAVHPDFREALMFVSATPKPLEKFQQADGKWVVRDSRGNVLYEIWPFDNGPDYPSEGLFRIVQNGKIGYADERTYQIAIAPQFDCAFPFENGKAKVSNQCKTVRDGEHNAWESDYWQYVDKKGALIRE